MNKSTPYFRAFLHITAFPIILIPCSILWVGAPLIAAIPIALGAMASVYWGVWLLMREVAL